MRPRPLGLDHCALPDLPTFGDLAHWLEVPLERLAWWTEGGQTYRPPIAEGLPWRRRPSVHYRALLLPKPSGGLRLIEAPKAGLKQAQRRLLEGLLSQVPVHEAAHGFVPGRSVASHAAVHAGQPVVVRFDLRDFFTSVRAAKVRAVWQTLGFPEGVSRTLAALCTTRTPPAVLARLLDDGGLSRLQAQRLGAAHLPQGAPTSPVLSNLCAFRLDLRLDGLAWTFGARYSRYADDLVLSGPPAIAHRLEALTAWVRDIAAAEGFELHEGKTCCMRAHQRQRVTGLVVNQRPQTPREDFDRLKAQLHRCALDGPPAGVDQALLRAQWLGQMAWVAQFNARRGEKLRRLFEQIVWEGGETKAAHA
jgi:RNA-directed DNA polymerase